MSISIERTSRKPSQHVSNAATNARNLQRSEDLLRKTASTTAGNNKFADVFYNIYGRPGVRTDVSLVPPIRQTASIFKQPVTIHKNQESIVKTDLKHGPQEKPRQLFWEKRLERMTACDVNGSEFSEIELTEGLKPVGPNVNETTLLQSIATSLHIGAHKVTGQTGSKASLDTNPGVFINVDQPLMYAYNIIDDDVRRQEDRVNNARRKLQDALKE